MNKERFNMKNRFREVIIWHKLPVPLNLDIIKTKTEKPK